MKKGFRRVVFGAVVGLVLVGSVALGQSDVGPSDAGTSGSPSLAEFLRAHKRVELIFPALSRISSGFWPRSLLVEAGTVGSLIAGPNLACTMPLRAEGRKVSGSCLFGVDDGDGKGPHRVEVSLSIRATSTIGDRLLYDVESLCVGGRCLSETELCWQALGEGDGHDCTLRPIYEAPTKPTPARVREFLAAARDARLSLVHECRECDVYRVLLHPDRRFCVEYPDRRDVLRACCGLWSADGLRVQGRCEDRSGGFVGSADFLLKGITAGGALFGVRICGRSGASGQGDCVERRGSFWLPHGHRDEVDEEVVELIQGSKSTELFDAAVLRLRQMYAEQWREAGWMSLPALVRGLPARHQRLETEVLFAASEGERAKRLAEATAKLLAPVVGPVEVRPWPGSSVHSVVVVIGERVATGAGKVVE